MKHTRLLAALLAGAFAACGGTTDPDELAQRGLRELNAGDSAAAATHLSRALETLPPDGDDYVRAQVGLAVAVADFDPETACDGFKAFASAHPELAQAAVYRTAAEGMFRAGAHHQAVEVMEAAVEQHPDDPELSQVCERMRERALQADVPDELGELSTIGYVGRD